jgi:hypothetical protein
VADKEAEWDRAFLPRKPFQPSLMFAGKVPRGDHLKGALVGKALALLTKFTLGWKGWTGANILTYFASLLEAERKNFITLLSSIKTFLASSLFLQ